VQLNHVNIWVLIPISYSLSLVHCRSKYVIFHCINKRLRSPTEAEDSSSNLCVQTGSGAHPASCTMGTGGSFPGGKARPGRDADNSPPSSAEVKEE
jgi:hypothetical protein